MPRVFPFVSSPHSRVALKPIRGTTNNLTATRVFSSDDCRPFTGTDFTRETNCEELGRLSEKEPGAEVPVDE